jgi:hypothetical protein
MDKICSKCKISKSSTDFNSKKSSQDGLQAYCKDCKKEANKKYLENKKIKNKKWIQNNYEHLKEYKKNWNNANREKLKEYDKKYKNKNIDKVKQYHKEYSKNWNYEKCNKDPIFKLKVRLRTAIYKSLKKENFVKCLSTTDIIGCSFEYFKEYIESLFLDGMNWNNYGSWHIDHIKPISLATTKEEIYQLNHYTNLQPLWALDNLKKYNKYEESNLHE